MGICKRVAKCKILKAVELESINRFGRGKLKTLILKYHQRGNQDVSFVDFSFYSTSLVVQSILDVLFCLYIFCNEFIEAYLLTFFLKLVYKITNLK